MCLVKGCVLVVSRTVSPPDRATGLVSRKKRLKTPLSRFKGDFATHANHAQRSDAPLGSHQQRAAQLARPGHRLERCKVEVGINDCEV